MSIVYRHEGLRRTSQSEPAGGRQAEDRRPICTHLCARFDIDRKQELMNPNCEDPEYFSSASGEWGEGSTMPSFTREGKLKGPTHHMGAGRFDVPRRKSRMHGATIGAVVLLLGVSAVMGTGVASAAPVPIAPSPVVAVPPELDPGFYRPSIESYANKAPGEIIAARAINPATFSLIPVNVDAWQVSYRSTNTRDEPIAAVTTLLKPRGQASTPRNLVSMQVAEDSTTQSCAPSYTVQQFSLAPVLGQAVVPAEFLIAQAMLAQGWAVSVPDHEGPDSAYGAGPLAARITLDGVRAAQNFSDLGVTAESKKALFGYSGGAIATGHAAELAQSYAPELKFVGAAEGGVPADLGVMLSTANRQATSGVVFAAMIGLSREYPELGRYMDSRFNGLGQALRSLKNPLCVGLQLLTFPFLDIYGLQGGGDPLTSPEIAPLLDETRMGKVVPDMPMFIWNANPDYLVPVIQVNTLVDTYCKDPAARVQYTRDHFSEHLTGAIVGAGPAMVWLKERFDGVPTPAGCSTSDQGTMLGDQAGTDALRASLGDLAAGLMGQALGADK